MRLTFPAGQLKGMKVRAAETEVRDVMGRSAILVRRFDRRGNGESLCRIHQEDFGQSVKGDDRRAVTGVEGRKCPVQGGSGGAGSADEVVYLEVVEANASSDEVGGLVVGILPSSRDPCISDQLSQSAPQSVSQHLLNSCFQVATCKTLWQD